MTPMSEPASNKPASPRPRGAVKRSDSAMVTVWIPSALLQAIDTAVAEHDTDRSKFVRNAIRRALNAN
jgi:hypothetical protein